LELLVILLGEFSSYGDKKIGKFFVLYCKFKKNWKKMANFQNQIEKKKSINYKFFKINILEERAMP
jgi:hypothetical protein